MGVGVGGGGNTTPLTAGGWERQRPETSHRKGPRGVIGDSLKGLTLIPEQMLRLEKLDDEERQKAAISIHES